ncbi:SDR family NAD(P)-dependent oxidoreductase [Sphingobacterium sp. LRF_L2]|uniref:SDR family NAD(P)-dependent oxidoreductase n=1 Tax=Sphingobacterium sp. LRF_L2 TaxID=3369421 RepID=UPI003F5DAB8D
MKKIPFQTALITGASSGIGKAFAYQLASRSVDLVLTARSEDKLRSICEDIKSKYAVKVSYIVADLSLSQSSGQIIKSIRDKKIEIDLLINNAGVGKWSNFLEQEPDTYARMIQLNVQSLVDLTHQILPGMLANKKGGIINIASTGALQPCPYIAVYCASKAFVLSFSEALHGEYSNKGISITAICPGNTRTDFQTNASANTEGMTFESPDEVAKQALKALLKNKNNKIIGCANYIQSFIPRLLPRKMVIGIVKKMMYSRVNGNMVS